MPEPATAWSVLVADADTGEVLLEETPTRVVRTASVAKVLLLTALAEALGSGAVDPAELLDRRTTPPVADSGLWQRLDVDVLPVGDVATLVGATSDNWATNVLIDRLGLDVVQAVAPRAGLRASQLHDRVRDGRGPDDAPTLSTGCADDWVAVMTALHRRTWVSVEVSERLLAWLAAGVDHSMVVGALGLDPLVDEPGPLRVVNKTGTDPGVRADVGLVTGARRSVAYAVLSDGPADGSGVAEALARQRRVGERVLSWAR